MQDHKNIQTAPKNPKLAASHAFVSCRDPQDSSTKMEPKGWGWPCLCEGGNQGNEEHLERGVPHLRAISDGAAQLKVVNALT